MKKFNIIVFIILSLLLFNVINTYAVDKEILITAHRGSSLYYPENTFISIENAIKEGADYVEVDVRLTKDNKVVLFHDNTLKRINGSDRSIEEMNLKDIQNIDNGSYKSLKFKGEKIPTLEEVFVNFGDKIKFNIELKMNKNDNYELCKQVSMLINKYSMSDNVVVSSFNKNIIERFKKDNENIKVGYITSQSINNMKELKCDFVSIKYNVVTKELVEEMYKNNKEVYVWTVNDENNIKNMIELDVRNIITDNVILVKKFI